MHFKRVKIGKQLTTIFRKKAEVRVFLIHFKLIITTANVSKKKQVIKAFFAS